MEKMFHFSERDHREVVVQVDMAGTGDDQQLFVVARQFLECIFAEIAGVRLFSVDHEHGTANFVAVGEQGHVDERKGRGLVPSSVGVERTFVIAAPGLIVVVIVFYKSGGFVW